MVERSNSLKNDLDELIGYLEDKMKHGESSEALEELYAEYQKYEDKILSNPKLFKSLRKLDREVTRIYG